MGTLLSATTAALTGAAREPFGGVLPFVGLLALLVLGAGREIATNSVGARATRLVPVLDVAILPLAMVCLVLVAYRLARVIL